jgi:hypothetical protein
MICSSPDSFQKTQMPNLNFFILTIPLGPVPLTHHLEELHVHFGNTVETFHWYWS